MPFFHWALQLRCDCHEFHLKETRHEIDPPPLIWPNSYGLMVAILTRFHFNGRYIEVHTTHTRQSYHMLYATVFTLRVFSDSHKINITVCCREALYGPARPHIGIQIENPVQIANYLLLIYKGCNLSFFTSVLHCVGREACVLL